MVVDEGKDVDIQEEEFDGEGQEGSFLGSNGQDRSDKGGQEDGGKEGDKGEGQEEEPLIPVSELERRLARAKEKHLEDLKKKEEEKADAIKKAKMTQAEAKAYDLEKREKEVAEREQRLKSQLLETSVRSKLSEQGLSDIYTDMLMLLKDEEVIEAKIGELKADLDERIHKERKARISQEEPEVERKGLGSTKIDFKGMGYKERMELKQKNEDLYNKLRKQL